MVRAVAGNGPRSNRLMLDSVFVSAYVPADWV